jgi:methylated-DNA-[protein]-cysteine S-methyltransferase
MSTNAHLVTALSAAIDARELSEPADVADRRARLVERADEEGLLDLTYRTVDSPVGALLLAASPAGLVRVAFEREGHDAVLAQLASAISPRILHSGRRTDLAARELDEYFAGRRRAFDVPVDLQLVHGFRLAVISHLSDIAYGATESYKAVAIAAGSPDAVRAVGAACAHNPVPVFVPCHRVIRSDGAIGQYLGGVEAKTMLLALERAA